MNKRVLNSPVHVAHPTPQTTCRVRLSESLLNSSPPYKHGVRWIALCARGARSAGTIVGKKARSSARSNWHFVTLAQAKRAVERKFGRKLAWNAIGRK